MSTNKVMRAALKTITSLGPDVEKTYKMERQLQILTSRLRGRPKDYKMWDHKVFCDDRVIPVRLSASNKKKALPLLLFFHGGDWVTGGIENYTGICADPAKAASYTIASMDYRLAPEHKFPAVVEDCYAVTRESFLGRIPRMNPDSITLIGDSAGGNLAAAVSLMARDRGGFPPKRQIFLYPSMYNNHSEHSPFPSIRENRTGYLLTPRRIQSFIELYRSSDDDLNNPYFAPLLASDFSRQPRTLLITAGYCPLRDEGEAYGEKLRAAGNDMQTIRVPDALHVYMMLPLRFEQVQQTYRIINGFLQKGNLHGRT